MTPQHDKNDKYEQCRKGEQKRERLVSFGVRKDFLDGTAEPGFGGDITKVCFLWESGYQREGGTEGLQAM